MDKDFSMALSVKKIAKLTQPGKYSDGGCLYLQVTNVRNRSWLFRYQRGGKERMMGLGPLHTFSLNEARERARNARQQLANGIDPLDARKLERTERARATSQVKTFAQCTQEFYDGNADRRWTNPKHKAQFINTLRQYAFPIIGNLSVADIDVSLVLKVLEQKMEGTTFWNARPETASRVRGRIETVLSWATVRGYRSGDNPARWQAFLSTQLPRDTKKKPHAALPFDQMPSFMADLRLQTGVAARALEFLILCTARTGAVTGARRDEIDFKEKIWTVPPDRAGTKLFGDKPRRIPLSDRAIEILENLPQERDNPYLFIGRREGSGLSNGAMAVLIDRMNDDNERIGRTRYVDPKLDNADITVHGFRSAFKDWVSERTNYPNHVSESALWHAVADKVEAAYRRGDALEKRRRMMQAWAAFVSAPKIQGKVVPMPLRSAAR